MDRRRPALAALLAFLVLTGVSIAVSGSRPHLDQGTAPWSIQVIADLFGIAGGVLLLASPGNGDGGASGGRRIGIVVMGALVLLLAVDALAMAADSGGANIGAGLVRLVCVVVIVGATARLAMVVAADRRAAP